MHRLPRSWLRVDDIARVNFLSQVRAEVAADHELAQHHQRPVNVEARCAQRSLVCFRLADGALALVALEWVLSTRPAPLPRTEIHSSELQALWAMAVHSGEHMPPGHRTSHR